MNWCPDCEIFWSDDDVEGFDDEECGGKYCPCGGEIRHVDPTPYDFEGDYVPGYRGF